MADLNAIKEDYRLRAEIAVGATASDPKYQAQVDLLKQAFAAKFDSSTGGDGSRATTTTFEGGSFSVTYPGATDQEVATALRMLIRELQDQINGGSTRTPGSGMRWYGRKCES